MPEEDSFKAIVGDIEPLRKSGRQVATNKLSADPESQASRRQAAMAKTKEAAALADDGFVMLGSEQSLAYHRPGLDKASLRRLTQGHMRPSISIDLHGYTIESARDLVWRAIREAQKHNDRCILIVHGKAGTGYRDDKGDLHGTGQALIKSHVNHWLQQVDDVLAFCSAQAKDGGTGAVYVLIKKKNKPKNDNLAH